MIIFKRVLLTFILLLITIESKELTNKDIIDRYYSDDNCLNLNENYICIDTSIKSNKLHNIIAQSQNLKPTYTLGISASKEELYRAFSKRKSISDKFTLHHYKQDNPIESKPLSKQFNNLFLNSLEDKIQIFNKKPNYLQIEKDIEPLTKLLKQNMFLIRFSNHKKVSVIFDKKLYEFIKTYMYNDIQTFNPDKDIPKYFHYVRNVSKISTEIVSVFKKRLNSEFSDKDINYLNNKISFLLSKRLRQPKKKGIDEGLSILYQLLVDLVSLSDRDKKYLYENLVVRDTNVNFRKERKIIMNFYKQNPLKVFIIDNEYKAPFTDGIYGYLYIHKRDFQKLLKNHQIDYLMLHEVNHVVYHLSSLKSQFSQMLKNIKLLNYLENMIITVERLIKVYDKNHIFQKDFLAVKNKWEKERMNIKEKFKLNQKNMINEMFSTNKRELNGMEELSIDLSNIHTLDFPKKNYYYTMLETLLPFSHPRLKPIKMNLQLDKFRQEKLNKKDYDLVKAFDSMAIILESSDDFRIDTYKQIGIMTEKFYYKLKELKKDYKTYKFVNNFYDINYLSTKLLHLMRYLYFKDIIIQSSVNYTRYSTSKGEF